MSDHEGSGQEGSGQEVSEQEVSEQEGSGQEGSEQEGSGHEGSDQEGLEQKGSEQKCEQLLTQETGLKRSESHTADTSRAKPSNNLYLALWVNARPFRRCDWYNDS